MVARDRDNDWSLWVLAVMLLALSVLMCLNACTVSTANQGEWSIDFRQGLTVRTTAARTADEAARVSVESQPLERWLLENVGSNG